jgi:hypothetical protein
VAETLYYDASLALTRRTDSLYNLYAVVSFPLDLQMPNFLNNIFFIVPPAHSFPLVSLYFVSHIHYHHGYTVEITTDDIEP